MKKFNKIIASVLSVATLVSVASCNNGGGGRGSNSDDGSNSETAAQTTTTDEDDSYVQQTYDTNAAVQNAVADVKVDETLKPTDKLVFMGNWSIDNTSPAIELFKANYGIPTGISDAYKSFVTADNENDVVISQVVGYDSRYSDLAKAVAADLSPDIFPFESDFFPQTAYSNMFQPIDNIIDMSGPEWDGWRELSEQFNWNGKHYLAPVELYPYYVLFYRRSIVQDAGLDDPYELYLSGEWDWDNFLSMADKFQKTGTDKYAVTGYTNFITCNAFASTGVPVVGIENGRLVNNLNNENVERAANFLNTIATQKYRTDTQDDEKSFISGNTLFYCTGFWYYQGTGHKRVEDNRWSWDDPDYETEVKKRDENGKVVKDENKQVVYETIQQDYDEIMFVPFPKDPNADKYYHYYKTFGYAFVAGSKNVEGYKAYIKCNIAALNDPDIQAAARSQQMENEKWTEKQMELKDKLYSVKDNPLTPLFDFKSGIDVDSSKSTEGASIDKIINDPFADPANYSFTNQRGQFGPIIQASIDDLNKKD